MDGLIDRWRPVIYPQNEPQRSALGALQEVRHHRYLPGVYVPYRVVTVWEPDLGELLLLEKQISQWRSGTGPKPRISLMSQVQGGPLQSIRLTVGEFPEPYRRGSSPAQRTSSGQPPMLSHETASSRSLRG